MNYLPQDQRRWLNKHNVPYTSKVSSIKRLLCYFFYMQSDLLNVIYVKSIQQDFEFTM